MNLLFMHPNMPGQFKHLCRKFAEDSNNKVVFVTKPKKGEIPGVRKIEYQPQREPQAPTHRYIIGLERGILCGQEVWRHLKRLKAEGFVPDVAVTHPGWGDALFLKDVYPDTPLLSFFEFYYHSRGGDVNLDPNDPITE
ncbi:MAG: glycosyl transferase family 1, partial [Alphaproteobacteria bacterium]|nr:glycosyl transferase family 1 [Alphaproteobacteria bacterium]